jgi:hypothetical protein
MSINIPDSAPRRLLEIDESIKFAGFTDRSGQKLVYEYRENLEPLLTEDELRKQSIIQAQIMNNLKNLGLKFGSPIFLSVLYEKVKLVTILLNNSKEYDLLMLSFDIGTDHQPIILNRILPLVKKGW